MFDLSGSKKPESWLEHLPRKDPGSSDHFQYTGLSSTLVSNYNNLKEDNNVKKEQRHITDETRYTYNFDIISIYNFYIIFI